MIHEHNLGPPQAAGDAMCSRQVATAAVCLSVCQWAFGSQVRAIELSVGSSCPDKLSLLMVLVVRTQGQSF